MMFRAIEALALCKFASVTVNVMPPLAAADGVPESVPLTARVNPAGRATEAQVYGGVPPVAIKLVNEYGTVASPAGKLEVLTEGGGTITMV
jgi:hypothetical protein